MYENSQAALNAYASKIAGLAKEVELEDTIDWSILDLDKDVTYEFIANSVVSKFDKNNFQERDVMFATITKLVVENFILNLKLQGK